MTDRRPITRIVVAADSARTPRGSLDWAARLAALLQSELAGLFIEDSVMAQWAEHPTVRVVGRVSGGNLPEGGAILGRALRRRAEALRAELEKTALRHRLSHTFAVRRGVTPVEIRQAARDAGLVLLAWTGGRRAPVPPEGRIVVLYDGSEGADHALITACDLSGALNVSPAVLLDAHSEREALGLQQRALEIAGGCGYRLSIQYMPDTTAVMAARAVEQMRGGVFLVPAEHTILEGRDADEFLDRVPCPVVVVG